MPWEEGTPRCGLKGRESPARQRVGWKALAGLSGRRAFGLRPQQQRRPAVPVASETISYRVWVVSTERRRRGQRQRFRKGREIPLHVPGIAILCHRETGP